MTDINTVITKAKIDNDIRTRRRYQIILHAIRRENLMEIDYQCIESMSFEGLQNILFAIINRTINEEANFLVNNGVYDMDWSFVSDHLEIEDCIAYLAENYVPTLCYRLWFPVETGGHGENNANVILYKMNLGILAPYQVSRKIRNIQGFSADLALTRQYLDENNESIGTSLLLELSDWARVEGFVLSDVDSFLYLDSIHKRLVMFASNNFENALKKTLFSVVPERKKYDDAIIEINAFMKRFYEVAPYPYFDPVDDFSNEPDLFDQIEKEIKLAQDMMLLGKSCDIIKMICGWSDFISKTYGSFHQQP